MFRCYLFLLKHDSSNTVSKKEFWIYSFSVEFDKEWNWRCSWKYVLHQWCAGHSFTGITGSKLILNNFPEVSLEILLKKINWIFLGSALYLLDCTVLVQYSRDHENQQFSLLGHEIIWTGFWWSVDSFSFKYATEWRPNVSNQKRGKLWIN